MTKRSVDIQQQADARTAEAHDLQAQARNTQDPAQAQALMQQSYETLECATELQSLASHADVEDEMGHGVTRSFPQGGVRR